MAKRAPPSSKYSTTGSKPFFTKRIKLMAVGAIFSIVIFYVLMAALNSGLKEMQDNAKWIEKITQDCAAISSSQARTIDEKNQIFGRCTSEKMAQPKPSAKSN